MTERFTKEQLKQIEELIAGGMPRESAVIYVGMTTNDVVGRTTTVEDTMKELAAVDEEIRQMREG